MSIDIRHLSEINVDRLTRLLARRPEYGIGQPSRRWQLRQEMKVKTLPDEMLYTSSFLKRLFIKLADSLNPDAVDPRAVLCKVHSTLNPWLIRRLFMAVAYEVTVHTDTLRSWKDKKDIPALSAFVGRIDAIAALWTEPELYRQCYGTPPFKTNMIFVQSGCEACILAAMGANARVLADLRAILLDRVERRAPRQDGRPAHDPRLARYIASWIGHLQEERAATCIARSDHVLGALRDARPQLTQWRRQRRETLRSLHDFDVPLYAELKRSRFGHQLTAVPNGAYCRRRTRNGVPVAMTDIEEAEEQRQAAVDSMQDEESIYRPDSMYPDSETGRRARPVIKLGDPPPPDNNSYSLDPYYFEEHDEDEEQELEQTLGEENDVDSHSYVHDWYADQLRVSHADLTEDDRQSVLSRVHPAFRHSNFTHPSAVPTPLGARENNHSRNSVWTDVTVHSEGSSRVRGTPVDRDAPPLPRIPSEYRNETAQAGNDNDNNGSSNNDNNADDDDGSPARTHWPKRPRQNSAPPSVASSVYSDQPPPPSPRVRERDVSRAEKPHGPPPAYLNSHARRRLLSPEDNSSSSVRPSSSASASSNSTNPYLRTLREYAAGGNPYSSRVPSVRSGIHNYEAPASEAGGSRSGSEAGKENGSKSGRSRGRARSRSVRLSDVPSMTSGVTEWLDDPLTPRTSMRKSQNEAWRRQLEDEFGDVGDVTPWPSFYIGPDGGEVRIK
ncbi:hypothetical protein F4821DRAFT_136621 [Hypoxylon rubiginosum]|uniref:Uncharacterized protein n=1 Tax=Hypoxylon rubiginosum TaxID=110542 RepID=A0ACC0DJ19_9PEZI|nr:hypothetical protein F4821DRAFT_136621 [Hypoxylon rubiginosum]